MSSVVSTIITNNYGHYALALHDSLLINEPDIHFCVFVSNGELPDVISEQLHARKRTLIFTENDFTEDDLASRLKNKYFKSYHDAYRWGMKPIVLNKLLKLGFEKAIYVDSDIYFFSDYRFLFERLNFCNVLLSPHWRSSCPSEDLANFKLNFLDGIYNGGFIGVSQGGEKALIYWAKLCLFDCKVDRANGFYVDQGYLDILPTRFENVRHIKHKGCNVANWNQVDCKRVLQADGSVLINNEKPIVFIHFTNSMFKGIFVNENDAVLLKYCEKYRDNILKYSSIDVIENFLNKGIYIKSRTENRNVLNTSNKHPLTFIDKGIKKIKQIKRKYL